MAAGVESGGVSVWDILAIVASVVSPVPTKKIKILRKLSSLSNDPGSQATLVALATALAEDDTPAPGGIPSHGELRMGANCSIPIRPIDLSVQSPALLKRIMANLCEPAGHGRESNAGNSPTDERLDHVSEEQSQRALQFLNEAKTPDEIAKRIEFIGERDIGHKLGEYLLAKRKELGRFENADQVLEVKGIGNQRRNQILKAFRS